MKSLILKICDFVLGHKKKKMYQAKWLTQWLELGLSWLQAPTLASNFK